MSKSPDLTLNSILIIKDNRVDLIALVKYFWVERRIVFVSVFVSILIGLLVFLLSPSKYRAVTVLLPHIESKTNLGQLGGLAGLAGVNLSGMLGDESGIQPEIYPIVVQSYPFINELINTPLSYRDSNKPVSYMDKEMGTKPGLGRLIVNYTIRLPWTIKHLLSKSEEIVIAEGSEESQKLVFLDKRRLGIYEQFKGVIVVNVDRKTNMVTLEVELEEPLVAAQLANKAVETLQDYITQYKTNQVRENLFFIEARFKEKRDEFEIAQRELHAFRDTYRNPVAERIDSRFQELQDNYNLLMSVYQDLAKQLEQARIAVQKEIPLFSVIEPVKVPIEKSSPLLLKTLVLSSLIGALLAGASLIGKIVILRYRSLF